MSIQKLSSRDFNQDTAKAKKASQRGPVIITDRGRPAHVLMTYADYEKLSGAQRSIVELLGMTSATTESFDPQPVRELPLAATFD